MKNRMLKAPAQCLWALFVIALVASGCTLTRGSTDDDASGVAAERGSGSEIRGERITRGGERSVEEILQGRLSGVYVTRASDGGFQLRIRGASTFSGSNEPLIVIDGNPLAEGYRGSIPVNPYDIESIRVLKSATETAFYGIRGANGVIYITTKRGRP